MLKIRKKAVGLFQYAINGNDIYDDGVRAFIANSSFSLDYGQSGEVVNFAVDQIEVYDDTGAGTSIPFSTFDELAIILNDLGDINFSSATASVSLATNTVDTASEIDLSNPLGNYCNADSANSSNSFTVINDVNGGWAKVLINNTNPPEVIGGSIENGNEFEPNTDMYLVVYSFSGNIKFFYLKVESTFEVVIVPKESEYVDLVGNLDLSQDGAVLITNYGTLEDATWDYEFDHTRDWSLTFKGTESPLGVPRNVQGLDNLQLLNISDDSVIINSSFRTLGQSRQFWSIGGQNIASSDNSFEMNQKLELRNIGGTIAIYNNDSFVANHNNSLTENVRLKLSLDDYNLYDFKFRYL